jgi:ABC-type Fe3+/spermidine/putrescine transport system ATPase subunit
MITVKGLKKTFDGKHVLRNVSFKVDAGEVLGLVGPSGVGKSTTLNIIAGLLEPDGGEVEVDGAIITRRNGTLIDVPPANRSLGYVMQDNALFPNMNVRENIAFGPESQGLPKAETISRVNELLSMVGIREFENSYPNQLSGGQQKRVALARTLAVKPKIILLDEPFTSLDPELKKQLMTDVKAIFDVFDTSAIYVTHDPSEASEMVDRFVKLEDGVVEQL